MTTRSTHAKASPPGETRAYRPELQGLRALAVTLVVVYHVWFDRVSGGVDVFFVISGFLLTGQLSRAAAKGSLGLARRWSRMLLRLLPAAATVLVFTVAAGLAILPEGRWHQTLREVAASVLFLENWQLAADSVDYTARSNATSVVQHFWSLSIQGQFFLLWPLLVAVLVLASRTGAASLHTRLTFTALGLFVGSLTYSIALTVTNQPLAYFHSLTRVWEFALGALLALWIDRIALPLRLRFAMGWIGVLGLIACGLVLQVSTVFPGYAALWPTGCAALVLLAERTGLPHAADRILAGRAARYVGDISYSLYLWHWPVLILFLVARDQDAVGWRGGVLVITTSVVLAVLTHHLIEQPVIAHGFGIRAGYRLGVVAIVTVLLCSAGWQVAAAQRAIPDGVVGDRSHPGARALVSGEVPSASLLPPPVSVYDDWVREEGWTCAPMSRFPSDVCTEPVAAPSRRIVVVGDSHIEQLEAVLAPIAHKHNWQLISMLRGACPFSTASETDPAQVGCVEWNDAAAAEIVDLHPDAVVTLASMDARVGLTERTPAGFVAQWQRLHDEGIPVLAFRDNPRFDFSMPDCVAQHGRDSERCSVDRSDVYAHVPPYLEAPGVPPNVTFVDISDAVCTPSRCPGEIGNVLVYLDDNHLTATYATSMSPLVRNQVVAVVGR